MSKEVNGKLLDSMMLDYLLDQAVKQERIYLHLDAVGNYTLDGKTITTRMVLVF